MKKEFLAFTMSAIGCVLSYGQTVSVTTDPVGVYSIECPANADTRFSIPTTRAPEFTGVVESVQSAPAKIAAKGEPNWATNKFVYAEGSQSNHYYLKFTSGELEGAWYDITSNDAYSVTINIGEAELEKVAVGNTFQIIPHWTPATLFPDGASFTKCNSKAPDNVSYIYKYTGYENGEIIYPTGKNNSPMMRYFYSTYNNRNSWMSSLTTIANDDIIEPNAVLFVRQPTDVSTTINLSGDIPMCKTSLVISNLSEDSDTDNYISIPSATDIEISELTEAFVSSGAFIPQDTKLTLGKDVLYTYDNSEIGKNVSPTHAYYYKTYNNLNKWYEGSVDSDSNNLKACSEVIMLRKQKTGELKSYRITFTPKYINQ